jgi:calcineurin-like phosphoesterase family protein
VTAFVIADLHLGDERVRTSGRPQFANLRDMEEAIVCRWNQTIRPTDTVYVLGDVGHACRVELARSLFGRKHLVAGNCDRLDALIAARLFETVTVARWLPGFLLTHIPVHPSQLRGRTVNVHGHLHSATVGDPRYRCVSADQTDFAPVPLADLSARPDQGRLL